MYGIYAALASYLLELEMNKTVTRREALRIGLSTMGLTCAFSALPCVHAASAADTSSTTLTVGVRNNIPGFGEYNKRNGKYYGLEIDIAQELASRMGYSDVTFKTVTPDTRKEMLSSGKIDCIVACYSSSDTRKKNFDFSPSYYTDHIVLMVQKSSNITRVNDLQGLTIGTREGADTAPYLAANLTKRGFTSGEVLSTNENNTDVTFDTWHLVEYATYPKLSDALERGDIDALAADGAIASAYLDDKRMLLPDYEAAPQNYAVATNKNSALSKKIAKTAQEMLDDKTIAGLIDKWD